MSRTTILLIAILTSTRAFADAAVLIKLGTVAPDGSPWQQLLREVEQDWTKQTSGEVTLRIYPGGVLGDESDLVKKLRIGQLHAVALSGGGMEHLEPTVACLQLPLMFDSYAELDAVRDQMAPTYEQRLAQKGFIVLNWSDAGWVHFFSKKPALSPDDIRTMKLYTSADDEQTLRAYRAAGFKPVPLSTSDMQTALSTGMIDVFDVPPLLALLNQWFASAPHMIDVKWAPVIGATIVAKKTWDKLAPARQAALKESAVRIGTSYRGRIRQLSEEAVSVMQKNGLQVHAVDGPTLIAWQKQAEVAWAGLRGITCPPEMFDEIVRRRDAFRAAAIGKSH